ncbi:MAG: hypothetical protein NTX61_16955 [Bacteroidetes bacterium]|nr:hypothetical protein [Bacteroidota bacterium]
MKKHIIPLFLFTLLFGLLFMFSTCSSKKTVTPCDNKGSICIENKLDTTLTVSITQLHNTFDITKDYMKCIDIIGDQAYTLSISSLNFQMDTTLFVLPCDKHLLIIKQ